MGTSVYFLLGLGASGPPKSTPSFAFKKLFIDIGKNRAYQKCKMFSEFHTCLPKDEVWQDEHHTEEKN